MSLHVLEAGVRTTVQDAGRIGHERSGVPRAGPADPVAFRAALALVGLDERSAAIEIVGLPFTFRCDGTRVIAATGPGVKLRARTRVPGWTAALVRSGEEVTVLGQARYAYLAVSGGIELRPVLGSFATYVPASIGPVPRPLRPGDELALGAAAGAERAGTRVEAPEYRGAVRALIGPHAARFVPGAVAAFFREPFTVLEESDRMGTRIAGPELRSEAPEILTCGLVAGAVQVPRGGRPIVLGPDHQTTGGYPVLAVVAGVDLGRVAQTPPGESLRFVEVGRAEAIAALRRSTSAA